MDLSEISVWLVTRGGDRAPYYQSELVDALRERGLSVEVVAVDGLLKTAAQKIGARAGEWFENAAGRLARGLKVDRLLGGSSAKPNAADAAAASGGAPEGSDQTADAAETPVEGPVGPDVVVIDEPTLLPTLRVAHPEALAAKPLTVGLVDDFAVDPRWRSSGVRALIAPHQSFGPLHLAGDSARLADGPHRTVLVVAAPPVGSGLISDQDKTSSREQLGLDVKRPVVLVAAEDIDAELLDRAVFQLTLLENDPIVLFHYGDNPDRAAFLRTSASNYGLEAMMFGEVDTLAHVYAAVDAILVAADSVGLFEYLATGRPVVPIGSDRGASRVLFASDQRAVLHVEDVVELSAYLDGLLDPDSKQSEALIEAAALLVPADGTARVADAVVALTEQRADLTSPAPTAEVAKAAPAAATAKKGVFESIGSTVQESTESMGPPLTIAEAKDQMAKLILRERDAERSLGDCVRIRDRWLDRLGMAREQGDTELEQVAEMELRRTRSELGQVNEQIETIRRAKGKLKARVQRSQPRPVDRPADREGSISTNRSDIEARFRRMELERDLARLRRKLDN